MNQPPGAIRENTDRPSTAEQRKVQALALVLAVCFSLAFSTALAAVAFTRLQTCCDIELKQSINPNDAPLASLVRLPGIGVGRAAAITEYRRNYNTKQPVSKPFESAQDLLKLKSFGPKTVQNISPWLRFEEE